MASIPVSGVLSGLSAALDITEGHPRGHAARSCLIGMHLAEQLQLSPQDRSDLFYGLLLKDAGCSSNAGRVFQLFGGPEHQTKRAVWIRDWRRLNQQVQYAVEVAEPGGTLTARMRRLFSLAKAGSKASRELFQIRCDRGAQIARGLGFTEATAHAIHTMDEHWDGGGHPGGLRKEHIPLAGRIIGLSQVLEIFWGLGGPDRALEVARARRGRWFDPALVDCLLRSADSGFWDRISTADLARDVSAAEPVGLVLTATEERLDQIARAFAWVIDAKSSFTYHHSERVAELAVRLGAALGCSVADQTRLRRAGLLHDIGKLSVPNSILDKPGRLTEGEWIIVKEHPYYSLQILQQVPVFRDFADDASNHHERLDGNGYFRGLTGAQLSQPARILVVADIIDALMSDRPYRQALSVSQVAELLQNDRGTALCADVVDVAKQVLSSTAEPERLAS
ncbi:MAG TPA: HD domain-containing phosphohydrolase [Vicinamibacterales bacterium]|nr:HD domain-containing phosphohydrolase [Vicinamibacterales bacterium]